RRVRCSSALSVFLLLLPAAVFADDACLTGSSLLGDQRTLAAVHDGTESACPCASFTGTPGLDRKAYRICARTVVDAALNGGTLRAPCKRTAATTYKGVACGVPGQAPCGRFKPGAGTPLSCRIKPPAKCHGSAAYAEHSCGAQTHCADVIDWTASTCV